MKINSLFGICLSHFNHTSLLVYKNIKLRLLFNIYLKLKVQTLLCKLVGGAKDEAGRHCVYVIRGLSRAYWSYDWRLLQ